MRLLLHIGIYKTGSSYLQYLCSNNRDELAKQGVFFPSSLYDEEMKKGGVSPGNGHSLSAAIRDSDKAKIKAELSLWIDEAKQRNCDSVLISSEFLVHDLADTTSLKLIEKVIIDLGISEVSVFAFIRNLVDHALSTYKHRAKQGQFPDFEQWLSENYETPKVLTQMVDNIDTSKWDWSLFKFEKSTEYLCQAFFENWLNVNIDTSLTTPLVNESISLSEVRLMTMISRYYNLVSDQFVEVFQNIPKSKKGDDSQLEICYRGIAYKHLKKHQLLIDKFNVIVQGKSKLCVGDNLDIEGVGNRVLVFSEEQLEAFIDKTKNLNSLKGKALILRRKIRNMLPKRFVKAIR